MEHVHNGYTAIVLGKQGNTEVFSKDNLLQ